MQDPIPAKLVVISGELTGQVYPLETTKVTFGRDSSNRHRCARRGVVATALCLQLRGRRLELRDVGSSNGTFVNGRQIESHRLADGDRIAAGSSLLLFARDASGLERAVAFDEGAPLPPTTRLALRDVVYFGASAVPPVALHSGEEGLKALLAISLAIHAVRDEGSSISNSLICCSMHCQRRKARFSVSAANREFDIQAVRPLAAAASCTSTSRQSAAPSARASVSCSGTPGAKARRRTNRRDRARRRFWLCPWRCRAGRSARFT